MVFSGDGWKSHPQAPQGVPQGLPLSLGDALRRRLPPSGYLSTNLPVMKYQEDSLLPFDCCRGFAGDVVDYSVYAADFVYYAVGYDAENLVRDA